MAQQSVLNLTSGEPQFEYNFINLLKRSQRINGGRPTNDPLDYPTDSVDYNFTMYFPETGTYVCRWLGSGKLDPGGASRTNSTVYVGGPLNGQTVPGGYTGGGAVAGVVTNGRFTFTKTAGSSYFAVIQGPTISDAVVCLADEEYLLDQATPQLCRPDWIQHIADFTPKCHRFMDMQFTNTSVAGYLWSDMPSADRLTYSANICPFDKKTGSITGTDNYVSASYTGMPVAYTHGEVWWGTIANTNTSATMTIDSGGRGAKTLQSGMFPGGETTSGTDWTARPGTTRDYAFVYNAYTDKVYFFFECAPMGYPIPVLVQMCNETSTPGYFCIPFFASDAWITSFSDYLVANYEPSLVYIEFCNEIWNSATGFLNNARAKAAGLSLMGLTGGNNADYKGYQGLRTRQIAEIMRPIFATAGQSAKLQIGLGVQISVGSSVANLQTQIEDLLFQNTSTATSGTLGTPATNLSGANAPILDVDFIAPGLYWYGSRCPWLDASWTTEYDNPPGGVTGIDDVLAAADNFALGTVAGKKLAFDFMYDQHTGTGSRYANVIVDDGTSWLRNWNALAVEHDKSIIMYECSHEMDAPSTSWCTGKSISTTYGGRGGKIDLMFQGYKNSQQFERVEALFMNFFYSLSKSEAWSAYAMGIAPPWSWFPLQTTTSTLGGDTTQAGFGNWRAHCKRNNGLRTFRVTTS